MMSLLAYEAKRRPEIAALVERCVDMTDAEIDTLVVPMKWFRTALKRQRDVFLGQRLSSSIGDYITSGFKADVHGEAFEYRGDDDYISLGHAGLIQIRYREYFFLPDVGGIWLDSFHGEIVDPKLSNAVSLGRMKRMDFKQIDQSRKQRNCPIDAQVIDLSGNSSGSPRPAANSVLAQYGVRIG